MAGASPRTRSSTSEAGPLPRWRASQECFLQLLLTLLRSRQLGRSSRRAGTPTEAVLEQFHDYLMKQGVSSPKPIGPGSQLDARSAAAAKCTSRLSATKIHRGCRRAGSRGPEGHRGDAESTGVAGPIQSASLRSSEPADRLTLGESVVTIRRTIYESAGIAFRKSRSSIPAASTRI